MAIGQVDDQPVVVPCNFNFFLFRQYMIEHVGLSPEIDCQQFFEQYSDHRITICGKNARRHMDHQPHPIPIFLISISSISRFDMPMGLTAPTAGSFLGPGPLFTNVVGPNAMLNVPTKEDRSLSPYAAEFLPSQVAPYGYVPTNVEGNSGSNNIGNGDTSDGDTNIGDTANRDTSNGDTSNGDTSNGAISDAVISNGDNSNGYTKDGDASNGFNNNRYTSNGNSSNGINGITSNVHVNNAI